MTLLLGAAVPLVVSILEETDASSNAKRLAAYAVTLALAALNTAIQAGAWDIEMFVTSATMIFAASETLYQVALKPAGFTEGLSESVLPNGLKPRTRATVDKQVDDGYLE